MCRADGPGGFLGGSSCAPIGIRVVAEMSGREGRTKDTRPAQSIGKGAAGIPAHRGFGLRRLWTALPRHHQQFQREAVPAHDPNWHRCPMRPSSVGATKVEQELADQVLACVRLDGDWRQVVLKALEDQGPKPDHSVDVKRINAALAKLRKQHPWGAIDDGTFKAEHRVLQRQVRGI